MKTLNRLLPAAVMALAIPGCIPTVWLPDSSGFIYVKPHKAKAPGEPADVQLLHFDLQKKSSRVVVDNIGPDTIWPAVSPDGKRIAVTRFKGGKNEAKKVQVVLYDMAGKVLHSSKEFPWSPAQEFSVGGTCMLFWSPKDDKMVVTDFEKTGIYDLKSDAMKVLEKGTPAIYGGTPIRADSKGFLALVQGQDKDKRLRLSFIDWTGNEQAIDTAGFEKALTVKGKEKKQEETVGALGMGFMFPSGWDGATAWAGFKRSQMTWKIDTVKNAITVSDKLAEYFNKEQDPAKSEPVIYEFPGDISVKVEQLKERSPQTMATREFSRVSIINHKTGKTETLAKVAGAFSFATSPNGNYVNVSLGELLGTGNEPPLILVINNRGELHAKITIEP